MPLYCIDELQITYMYFYVFIILFSAKKSNSKSILLSSDPDPVPDVRIRIRLKRSGSDYKGQDPKGSVFELENSEHKFVKMWAIYGILFSEILILPSFPVSTQTYFQKKNLPDEIFANMQICLG
jgi:hypothetical protein